MTDTLICDCCNETVPADQIRTVIAYGIETSACANCRGAPMDWEADLDEREAEASGEEMRR